MSHKLYRLLDSVYNTPHLILESSLKPIVEYLQDRNSPDYPHYFAIVPEAKSAEKEKPEQVGGIGEIKIDGVLTYQPVNGMCGPVGVSYQGILEEAAELIGMGVDTIILTFSSSGGQAAHCFTTCNELREMADEAGVRLISYIDTRAASAALALSVISDEVIIHPSAETGSVGCVCCILDQSKALEKAGLKPVYVASTPGKTPFQEDGSFSEGFLNKLQEDVTRLGNEFAEHVAKYTGLKLEDILAMDAQMFHASKALEIGLVNKVMDHKQFAAYLAETKGAKNAKSP